MTTATRMVKRSIPLLIAALALMVVPKTVLALNGCYIFVSINLTSTGFPYNVAFYAKVGPNRFVRNSYLELRSISNKHHQLCFIHPVRSLAKHDND